MENDGFECETSSDEAELREEPVKERCPPPGIPGPGNGSTHTLIVKAGLLGIYFTAPQDECKPDHKESKSEKGEAEKAAASHQRRMSWLLLTNLLTVSVCVLLVLSAYDMVRYVESSLTSLHGIGTAALASNYAVTVPCLLLLPTLLVRRLGLKWTLVTTVFGFMPFFAAHFYPRYYTLVPAAIFMGLGSGIMETIANCAVTELAMAYAALHMIKPRVVLNRFFGVFVMIILTSRIWGNTATSYLMQLKNDVNTNKLNMCGVAFCSSAYYANKPTNASEKSFLNMTDSGGKNEAGFDTMVFTMYGIGVGVTLIAGSVVAFCLRPLPERRNSLVGQSTTKFLMATIGLMKQKNMLCLIPITISLGLLEAFVSGDFTEAFVTCSLGLQQVGPIIICYGVTAAAISAVSGFLSNLIGRFALFLAAFLLNISLVIFMCLWTPNPSYIAPYYVTAAGWGAADAIRRTQLFALYGNLFKRRLEAAFSCLEIGESVGLMLGYAGNDVLCLRTKMWILVIVLLLGLVGCSVVEIGEIKKGKKTSSSA